MKTTSSVRRAAVPMAQSIGPCAALLLLACGGESATKDPAPQAGAAAPPVEREGYALTPDSVKLWYRVVGTGAQTVIFNGANYHQKAFDALVTPTRRIVLYDVRGRGKTDSVPPSKTGIVEFHIDDIDVIRKAVGADSIALIGWSGGAPEMFRYALRHPSLVTRLVLLNPVGPRLTPWWDQMRASARARTDTAASARLAARVTAGEFASDEAALCREQARLGNRTNFADTSQARLAPDVCDSPNELPGRYGTYVGRLLDKLGKYDWRSDLPKVTVPRLVIHGEFDNPPVAGSREWVAGLPNARLLVITGVGHWPHYEKPDYTIAAISDFLDGKWPAESEIVPANP